jgi:UDP-2-acetamido-3-amino-2,3-dideoxy-glucuronate N-acetyltransferase
MTISDDAFIHPSAVIDLPVDIGASTKIWHFCHIMSGARIGSSCLLGQNVYVASSVVVGDGCRIQNNVSLYDGVTLEQDVFLGPSCVFTNIRNPRASFRRHDFEATHIARGATLGANCTVVAGCAIGRWAFVGAGSVITKAVPDYALVVGNPARLIGWVSRRGTRLKFNEKVARCPDTGETYRLTKKGVELEEPRT